MPLRSSGFYLAMMLALIALILRPVGFKYQQAAGATPGTACSVFGRGGLAGVRRGGGQHHSGRALHVRRPRCAWSTRAISTSCSRLSRCWPVCRVAMLAMHGAVLLAWRTEGVVASRARNWGRLCAADRGAVRGRRFLGRGRAERPRHHQRGRRAGPIRSHAQDRQRAGRRLDGQLRQVAADVDRARAGRGRRCWRCCS